VTTSDAATHDAATPEPEALFTVVSGSPTPHELAAVADVVYGLLR
jgi:hypothetical protein